MRNKHVTHQQNGLQGEKNLLNVKSPFIYQLVIYRYENEQDCLSSYFNIQYDLSLPL